jgi:tyrosyl-tRNA synthetase
VDTETRVARVVRHAAEVLTPDELRTLFEREPSPRAYIGFEPSGLLTVGQLVTARKMRDLLEAGCRLTVFLADWHAWINDKLGGSIERIRAAGRYMEAAFGALGVGPERTEYRFASELVAKEAYWVRVLRVAKATSVARTKRAMTILGRREEEAELDTSRLFYPAMQAADIFELPVDIAYAGMDQRRAHALAREVAHRYGWTPPVAVHTPIVSSLTGGGRMDPTSEGIEKKMSKSDPTSSIVIPSSPEVVRERLERAFCPAREVDGNPVVELARYVVLPWEGRLAVERPAKYGGAVEFATEEALLDAWRSGGLHPKDLKTAVGESLNRILEPARAHFRERPESLPEFLRPTAGPSRPDSAPATGAAAASELSVSDRA